MLQWASEKRIRPHVSMTFELNRFREALEALQARKSTGKIVLTTG